MSIFGCANDEQFLREIKSYGDFYSMSKKQITNIFIKNMEIRYGI